jgi:heme/copper-type cytochrome/quinol oxidase subunit 1
MLETSMLAAHLSPTILCILGSVFLCLLSVLSLLFPTQSAIDVPIRNTYYPVGPFHIGAGFAVVFIAFAGVYSGFPLLVGRTLNDRLSQMHVFLTIVGSSILILVIQIMSVLPHKGITAALLLGCASLLLGQLVLVFNLLWRRPEGAGNARRVYPG